MINETINILKFPIYILNDLDVQVNKIKGIRGG